MKIEKEEIQLNAPNLKIRNVLVKGHWYSISQEKINEKWRTEINGELVSDGAYDLMPIKEGLKRAMEQIKNMASNSINA